MKNAVQRMVQHLLLQTTAEQISIVRNTYLAASALSAGILVALTQVGATDVSLKVAVVGCTVAAPISLGLAAALELYLHMGERAFPHLNLWRTSRPYLLLQYLVAAGIYVAMGGVVYFLVPLALVAFIVASVLGMVVVLRTYIHFAAWWASNQSESNK